MCSSSRIISNKLPYFSAGRSVVIPQGVSTLLVGLPDRARSYARRAQPVRAQMAGIKTDRKKKRERRKKA